MTFNNLNQINNYWNVSELNLLDKKEVILILKNISKKLMFFNVEKRIKWALKYLPQRIVLSSSFGIQSVVSLHLFTKYCSNIPIILIDTGYLFPETYRFIDELTKKMKLNLYVFRPKKSAAWQEARYGKLWEQGIEGIQRYNIINKVEPMIRALKFLKVGTWCSGLRRKQSDSRKNLLFLSIQQGVFKYFPIVDWSDCQINEYIKKNNLRYHPLQKKGYVSLGDIHTTSKWTVGMRKEDTRFFGLKRECGLHEVD